MSVNLTASFEYLRKALDEVDTNGKTGWQLAHERYLAGLTYAEHARWDSWMDEMVCAFNPDIDLDLTAQQAIEGRRA